MFSSNLSLSITAPTNLEHIPALPTPQLHLSTLHIIHYDLQDEWMNKGMNETVNEWMTRNISKGALCAIQSGGPCQAHWQTALPALYFAPNLTPWPW